MLIEENKFDIKYVALYLRKSRGDEDTDLDKHKLILHEMCKKNEWKYVEYIEIGSSDSIEMRPKMKQLLEDVSEGIYDAVCVVDYDRLSRGDLGEQDKVKKAFQKSNTLIITPDKIYNLNNDLDDTYADFKGFFARQEYKMITKRLQQGKKIGARRGDWTNGTPPFPYEYERYENKYNPKGLVVNDEKLKIYRRIIIESLNNIPPQTIAWNLNKEGILSPKGCKWSNVTINRLISNEIHLGKIISNKSEGDGHKVKKSNSKPIRNKPKSEWIVVENCHEAIKTQEEHDIIMELIRRRSIIPNRARAETYSLSGLIKCKNCNHTMTFIKKPNNLFLKPCWYKDDIGNKCYNRGVIYEKIEDMIIEQILQYRENIVNAETKNEHSDIEYIKSQIETNSDNLVKHKKALDRVNDSYDLGDYTREQWLERKSKWEQDIFKTQSEIDRLSKVLKNKESIQVEDKIKQIDELLNNLQKNISHSDKNKLFKTIIESVVWKRTDKDEAFLEINFR